jgi:hypothetical protein
MSASKQKGTRWESATVDACRAAGFTTATRVPLAGTVDKGDVHVQAGDYKVVVQNKNEQRLAVAEYVDQANAQCANAEGDFGVAWVHRRGKSRPEDGYVMMDGSTWLRIMQALAIAGEQ